MEYLMTYGWSILIIAVVLGALFQLGIFNSANFAPRAQPGNCRVLKAGTQTTLEGVCSGELPMFVAATSNPGGSHQYVSIPAVSSYSGLPISVSLWIYPIYDSLNFEHPIISKNQEWLMTTNEGSGSSSFGIWLKYENCYSGGPCNSWEIYLEPSESVNYNKWYNMIGVYTTGGMTLYVDGVGAIATNTPLINPAVASSNPVLVSNLGGGYYSFSGSIANVQIYSASLNAAEANALYNEGIGGAPVLPTNVVGWWPLNGDTNDYSGSNNAGQLVNGVGFTSSWIGNYTNH